MMGLTEKQKQTLDFIRAHYDVNGLMPSYSEIADGIGVKSRGRINQVLDDLEERGAIRRIKGRARAMELVDPEKMSAVLLNSEIHGLLRAYAQAEHIGLDTAANQLLRDALGAAA